MTIKKFTPGRKPSGAVGTPVAAQGNSKSVTLFQNGRFGLHFEGTQMKLAIAPQLLANMGNASGPAPIGERGTIIELLGLDEAAAQAIDKIAAEHDLTFSEALNFHLAMTLPD
jgi:hypothetical protein